MSKIPIERLISMITYDVDSLAYHYTSLYPALEYILPNKRIRLSRFDRLNDPKESRPIFQFARSLPGGNINAELITELYNRFLTYTKLLCLTIDDPKKYKLAKEANPFPGKGYNHPRMWAQYANNHRGVCIVIDLVKLYEELLRHNSEKNVLQGKVTYSEKYLDLFNEGEDPYKVDVKMVEKIGIEKYYYKHLKENKRVYYFNKHSDWKDENEYRIVILDDNSNDVYVRMEEIAIAVIVGSEFPDAYKPSLITLCKELKIDAFKIVWNQGFAKDLSLIYDN